MVNKKRKESVKSKEEVAICDLILKIIFQF